MSNDNTIIKKPIEANGHGLSLRTLDDMYRFAQYVAKSGDFPQFNTPEKALMAIQAGAELGMGALRSLGSTYVIKGRTNIFGDTPLALVRQSGLMEFIEEMFEGENDDFKAVCTVKRRGDTDAISRTFSVADAKMAHLWGKAGPWTLYPKRMLQMRARSLALRDVFPDCFAGATIAEEYIGVEKDDQPVSPKVKQVVSGEIDDAKGAVEQGWTPEDLPIGMPPTDEESESEPKWECVCGKQFSEPILDGQCPKCLGKNYKEISDAS